MLTFTTTSLTLDYGANATVGVTVARPGGYAGPIVLEIDEMPTGITATLNPAVLTGSAGGSTITIVVGDNASVSHATLRVRALGAGIGASADLPMVVLGYRLSLAPSAVSVERRSGGTANVLLTLHIRCDCRAGRIRGDGAFFRV
ncbi:MAG: hypothetical protein ACREMA_07700 [Longimicrobiales bacterium]